MVPRGRHLFGEAARALDAVGGQARLIGALIEDDADRVAWDDWTFADVFSHIEASHEALLVAARGEAAPLPGAQLAAINEERRQTRRGRSFAATLRALDEARARAAEHLRARADSDWLVVVRTASGREWTLGQLAWMLSQHERGHLDELAALLGRPPAPARVAALNLSAGGVPKWPVFSGFLSFAGLAGDEHANPLHGSATAALCLFSGEVIDRLRAEGHPIGPGTIGENVTVRGLDWARIRPGDALSIGPARVEVTRFTTPCVTIKGSFADGQFARVHADQHPGEARVYARVLAEGTIAVGDPVEHISAVSGP